MTGEKLTDCFYYCGGIVKVILIPCFRLPPASATSADAAESNATQKNTKTVLLCLLWQYSLFYGCGSVKLISKCNDAAQQGVATDAQRNTEEYKNSVSVFLWQYLLFF
jgi:hypothetical protein